MRALDLSGKTFGRLTVVGLAAPAPSGHRRWECSCVCGGKSFPTTGSLRSAKSVSCGCGVGESASQRFSTHGRTATPEYSVWLNMRDRAGNPKNAAYRNYGGRGIKVCPEWDASFEAFYADVGPRPTQGHTLDRIDNNGGYEPGNCRWATWQEQAANRRCTRKIEHEGRRLTLSEWARETGLSYTTVRARFARGWSAAQALTAPCGGAS